MAPTDEVTVLRDTVNSLQEEVERFRGHQNAMESLNVEVSNLRALRKSLQNEIKELNGQIATVRENLEKEQAAAREKSAAYKEELRREVAPLEELRKEVRGLKKRSEELKEEQKAIMADAKAERLTMLNQLKGEEASLRADLTSLTQAIHELKEKVKNL